MMKKFYAVLTALVVVCFSGVSARAQNTLSEGFEAGGKTAYAAARVNLGSGSRYFKIDNITLMNFISGSTSEHLTMGNPSNAATDVNQPTNYLMDKAQYALSYNRDKGEPNWVSWHLASNWLGSTPRQDTFRADSTLPSSWYHVQATSYSGSGYDRGHMCPSGDRTNSVTNNSATFLMTNMIPQAPTNNQVTWANLENYSRTLVNSGNELYIISGGRGVSGYIANGKVAVPTYTWKVIMVLPSGTNDVSRVTTSTRLIAVYMPNNNSVVSDWKQYRVSVDYVESMTGYNFFSNVSDSVENIIEARVDTQ